MYATDLEGVLADNLVSEPSAYHILNGRDERGTTHQKYLVEIICCSPTERRLASAMMNSIASYNA